MADDGGELVVWDVEKRAMHARVPTGMERVVYTYVDGTGRYACAFGNGPPKLVDLRNRRVVAELSGATNSVAAFSRDGRRAIARCDDGSVRAWDTATGREVLRFTPPSGAATAFAMSPKGKWLVVGTSDGKVYFVDAKNGAVAKEIALPGGRRGNSTAASAFGFERNGRALTVVTNGLESVVISARGR